MTVTELISSVQFLVDAEGNKKAAVLDWQDWEKLTTLLESLETAVSLDDLLEGITEENLHSEVPLETMVLTEPLLQRDWDKPEEDEAWVHL